MIDSIGLILFLMLLLRFLVVLVNFLSKPYLKPGVSILGNPKVSVLIPARNEETVLPVLLSDLIKSNYTNTEIIVCNDHSTDNTEEMLQQHELTMPGFSYFNNEPLPPGWVGKNFACHELAKRATGDYFLFLDADVRLSADAIAKAVNHFQNKQTGLLSLFPQQIMITKGEWRVVPLMNWILLSFLPLVAVRMPWFSSLSAANGQFMMFESDAYRMNQWHQKVWNNNVEDILIARKMKQGGYKITVLTGNDDVFCRMYHSGSDAINGFARNIHHYFGGSRLWLLFYGFMVFFRFPFFALFAQWSFLAASLVLLISMKVMVSVVSRQNIMNNLKLHFSQLFAFANIVLRNLKIAQTRSMEWKGRVYRAN